MTLEEAKNLLFRASRGFAERIQPTYIQFEHCLSTKLGNTIPTVDDIERIILELIKGLKPGVSSVSTAGIMICLDYDESFDDVVDASIGYHSSVYTLLNEEDFEEETI